jgi:predicted alpha/beta-fold hydrolase
MVAFIKTLDRLSPGITARVAHYYMSNPQKRKLREFEEQVLRESRMEKVLFEGHQIQRYSWGKHGDPVALMVHGWEGQAGNFGSLVAPLLKKGFQVIAFDAPAHGKSSRKPTNMFQYANLITEKIAEYQPRLMITHSFGTVTTLFGLMRNPDFTLKQWLIVTTPFSFRDHVDRIKDQLGISDRTLTKLINLLERDTNQKMDDLNMETMAPEITNFERCTIIHSVDDRVIPFSDAERTSHYLKDSELIPVENLGHYRILWSDELIQTLEEKVFS